MSNDKGKREEKKHEEKQPEAKAAETAMVPAKASAKAVTALTVIQQAGIKLATEQELVQLEMNAAEKFTAFQALLDDASLPANIKQQVKLLVDLTNPTKDGMEEVGGDWTVPRINICQPTTTSSSKPDSAKPGDLYASSGQLIERPFGFIPIYFHNENIFFKQGQKQPECQSLDSKVGSPYGLCKTCRFLKYGPADDRQTNQDEKECNSQIVVTVVDADLRGVYTIPFIKTGYVAGKALMALAKQHQFAYKQKYLLNTEKKVGDKGQYWIPKVEPTGKDNDEHTVRVAAAISALYSANRKALLAKWYLGRGQALNTQMAMEQEFQSSGLEAGLNPSKEGEEPDLGSEPAKPSTVRSGARPM